MSSLREKMFLTNEMDFHKCGEILVAAKHNIFAMSCNYCQQRFKQFQAFMRHLQLQHQDKLEFGKNNKNVEVYAVEELITSLNQSMIVGTENKSEDDNCLTDKDKKCLDDEDASEEEEKEGFANMSILRALENCDVSLNLANNLENTSCDVSDEASDNEDDYVLNNTLLQQIQNECDVSEEDEKHNKTSNFSGDDLEVSKDFDGNVTMTDMCISSTRNEDRIGQIEENLKSSFNTKSSDLKGLLEGLEDLDDVDSLLENLEDSMVGDKMPHENKKLLNSIINKNMEKSFGNDLNNETSMLEDFELTLNQNKQYLNEENVLNYNLATKNKKDCGEIIKNSKIYNKNQQKMVLNIESGELEELCADLNQLDDYLEEENFIFNNFVNKTTKDNRKMSKISSVNANPIKLDLNLNNSITDDFNLQLNEQLEPMENENVILTNFLNKNQTQISNKSENLQNSNTTSDETAEVDDFDLKLKNLEESLNEDSIIYNEILNKNSINNPKISKFAAEYKKQNMKTHDREDFNLKLKNGKESLDEENIIFNSFVHKNSQENSKIRNFQKPIKNLDNFSKNSQIKLVENLEMKMNQHNVFLKGENEDNFENILTNYTEDHKNHDNNSNYRNTSNQLDSNLQLEQSADSLDEDTIVLNNFVNKSNKVGEKITTISGNIKNPCENGKNSKEIPLTADLNEDLTKALEEALMCDDLNLQDEEDEQPLNQDLKDLLALELMDESIGSEKSFERTSSIKSNNEVRQEPLVKLKESVHLVSMQMNAKSENIHSLKSRYQITNMKARNLKQQSVTKQNNSSISKSMQSERSKNNIKTKILTSQNIQMPLKSNKECVNIFKGNHDLYKQQKQITPYSQNPVKPKTPKKFKENQEDSSLSSRQRKTSVKENQENLTPDLIKKITKEKFTPHKSFINTERGDRTPLKTNEMFSKLSPKTQENIHESENSFTSRRGERTPKAKEQMFLKQSPRTQEKNEDTSLSKTLTSGVNSPKTREQIFLKQISNDKVKNEAATCSKLQKTPRKINSPLKKYEESPLKQCSISLVRPTLDLPKSTKNVPVSPTKNSKANGYITPLTTPQRLRNLTIKLQRLTPTKVIGERSSANDPKKHSTKSPTQTDKKPNWNNFKLPNGITITKISPSNTAQNHNQSKLDETPIKTSYCKQNFSESSLETPQQQITQIEQNHDVQLTLIKPQTQVKNVLKPKKAASRIRQRKASIDIVPSLPKNHNISYMKTTPKHTNLDYKSYAVNRTARKKEVLQRMSHIKKQIFKSIASDQQITKIKPSKATCNTQQRGKQIQIDNVQILPMLKKDNLTPLINPFSNFKKPCVNNVTSTPLAISPKNLNDDEKQAKQKYLQTPTSTSPINDDEKLIKSLKRPATSPLQFDGAQVKRLQISPSMRQKKGKSSEVTQLESAKEHLQHDLKANRLKAASFLNEELPIDDHSPNETSIESNGNSQHIVEKGKEKSNACNSNLLDDLLQQVHVEQKANEETNKKGVADEYIKANKTGLDDFDDTKDLNLLNAFGLGIIKSPDIEDTISLDAVDEMIEKARNFADVYKNWQRIWSSKNGEGSNIREELDISFKQLITTLNIKFNLELTMIDMKRIVNLITLWYAQNFNSKLIEKKKISDATNRYLLMFHYIPKTTKRFYYCEYCEEYFTTEHRYFTHRIVHTGATYPYKCSKCSMGFRLFKTHKVHEQKCGGKTQLQNVYNCGKCDSVFTSVPDIKNHMITCNRFTKRIQQESTPRPLKPKLEPYSRN